MSTKASPLAKFSEDEILEELVRRRNTKLMEKTPSRWCEDCAHFKVWKERYDPPSSYNPCDMGHAMSFWMPKGQNPHAPQGFYLRVCKDRAAIAKALGE